MKLQDGLHTCGPSALYNALQALGASSPGLDALAELAQTDAKKGTTTRGMLKALKLLSHPTVEIRARAKPTAFWCLSGALEHGWSVILAVDNDDHWVTAIGIAGNRVLVADSADSAVVRSLSYEELMARWACDGTCYGIAVGRSRV